MDALVISPSSPSHLLFLEVMIFSSYESVIDSVVEIWCVYANPIRIDAKGKLRNKARVHQSFVMQSAYFAQCFWIILNRRVDFYTGASSQSYAFWMVSTSLLYFSFLYIYCLCEMKTNKTELNWNQLIIFFKNYGEIVRFSVVYKHSRLITAHLPSARKVDQNAKLRGIFNLTRPGGSCIRRILICYVLGVKSQYSLLTYSFGRIRVTFLLSILLYFSYKFAGWTR